MSTADDNVIDAAEMFAKAKKLEPTITQDGIARVFAEKYGDKLRFDHTSSCWYRWDGTRWKIAPSPSPTHIKGFTSDILFGGTVIPTGDLWLVGDEFTRTLALHATGR